MKVKHCMAECSGIGYEMWTDRDLYMPEVFDTGKQFGICHKLRKD